MNVEVGLTTRLWLAALGLAATVALSTAPVQAQVSFINAQNFAAGDSPVSTTIGDLDGDGDLDLATANSGSDNVSVLKNTGNGTFAATQNIATGSLPSSITVGDLDGDGDLDLAVVNEFSYTVSVLKNTGTGTFAAAQNFPTGNRPSSITVGDLDGDGDLDLAIANLFTTYVSVLENNGTGSFAAPQIFTTGGISPNSITVGDLDGDGDLDLATANIGGYPDFTGSVSVLKNNGNGTFAAPQTFAAKDYPRSITVGDLDGDGDLDLATNDVSVLKNKGNGTFATAQSYVPGGYPRSITVGDLDGDGDLDLITANGYNGVSVLKNNGTGTFAAARNFAVGTRPNSITVGDLDGDGDLDLATTSLLGSFPYYTSTVAVLKNNGNGTFATAQSFDVGDSPISITVGDLDGDGDLDLATLNDDGSYPDFIVTVSVLKNNGNGSFAAPQNFTTGSMRGNGPTSITVGDLDGDSDLDLATTNNYTDTVSVLKNTGNGSFAAPQTFATRDFPYSITVGDLDRDGDLDLATANAGSNNVSVLKNNGNGTFAAARNFTVADTPTSITIGDLDEDGDLDLVTAARSGSSSDVVGTVSVLKNNGNGTFAAPQNFTAGDEPLALTIGDLDSDGDLDLATAEYRTATVLVFKNNGSGSFAGAQTFRAGGQSRSITPADLDRDGDLDLATANNASDSVSVLLSTTPTLQLSLSADRTNPVPLAGQTVKGNVYVFASGKDTDFLRVRFFIDDPDKSGESFRTETIAPFDLSGTSGSKANPSDSRALTNGTHTITATFARPDGTYRTITSAFTVRN